MWASYDGGSGMVVYAGELRWWEWHWWCMRVSYDGGSGMVVGVALWWCMQVSYDGGVVGVVVSNLVGVVMGRMDWSLLE